MPPQAVESEQAVLGGLMLAPDALSGLSLTEDDFYRRDHQLIFRAIVEQDAAGRPVDAVTLGEWFESKGLVEQVAGGAYLIELASTTPSAANIKAYADIVRDKAVLRQLIGVGTGIVNDGFDPDGRESVELVDEAVASLMAMQRAAGRHEYDMRSALNLAFADMQAAFECGGKLRGIPSGYSRLDARLGGFQGGDLIFIGARPKMGKTALMVNMVYNAAKTGHPCGVISGEQSALQLAQRFLSLETSFAGERMRNGDIRDEDWGPLSAGVSALVSKQVRIYDAGGPDITTVRRLARKWKKEHGIRALYVDYLQRLKCRGVRDRTEQVGEIARGLKDIARENDIAVISLAQVKREVETRNDKRPSSGDIANSDEATREADQILMLYRHGVYDEPTAEIERQQGHGTAELNLEANRHGPTGAIKLHWHPAAMKFSDFTTWGD
jgi:replicative DNA helicase